MQGDKPAAVDVQRSRETRGQRVLLATAADPELTAVCMALTESGTECTVFESLRDMAAHIGESTGAILLTADALSHGQDLHLQNSLDGQPAWSDIPIICLAGRGAVHRAPALAPQVLLLSQSSNMLMLEHPLSRESLASAIRSALKNRARQFRLRDEIEHLAHQAEALRLSRQDLVVAKERREFLFELVRAQRESTRPDAIMQLAAQALRQRLAAARVGFYAIRRAENGSTVMDFGPTSVAGVLTGWEGSMDVELLGDEVVRQLRAQRLVHYDDLGDDGHVPWPFSEDSGVPGGMTLQFHRGGQWEGGLYVNVGHIRHWTQEELALFEEAGHLAWDAVERAGSEQALKDREIQLIRTEERDRLWQLSRELLGVSDLEGRWRSVNPAWTSLLGWRASELLTQHVDSLVHPDDLDATRAQWARLSSGETVAEFENRLCDRQGKYRTLSWSVVLMDGLVYSTARDVTDQRAQSLALQQTEEQLRQSQKMEALGQLTGGIAHDFNNMLQGITISLEVLRRKLAMGHTDVDRFIDSATRSAGRAAALTHRLLAFSRRQPLSPARVVLSERVGGMADLLKQTLNEHIQLGYDLDADLPAVICDASQLENAVLNLVINARDALPSGGEIVVFSRRAATSEVHGEFAKAGAYAAIGVRDNGAGMSAQVAERAFDPFFTTKPIGLGTGLGLSMIYGFAQQSKGECRIDTVEGEGTTVTIYLPLADGAAAGAEEPGPLPRTDQPAQGTVLVVEDDEVVRPLVVEALEDMGLKVLQATDGPGGLSLLRSEQQIDVLVTDVGLPGLNGRQLADAAMADRPQLQVLFMTGYAASVLDTEGLLKPGMGMLTKPFPIEVLTTKVCEMIACKDPAT